MTQESSGGDFIPDFTVPETPPAGQEPKPWKATRVVGSAMPRVDGYDRVSGSAVFPSDVTFPDMLHAAILTCPHPNAIVQNLDAADAAKLPGVRAVLTAGTRGADLEWKYFRGKLKSKLFDPHCRYEGDTVAAVAAETPYRAWDAVRAIKVVYNVLPFIVDERKALAPDAPSVHGKDNRVVSTEKHERGNIQKGFSEADVVLDMEFRTECELHAPAELHGSVAKWDGDRLTVWDSTQGVFAIQEGVARVLGMPLSKVRVIGNYMGGGFGSKLEVGKYTVVAALLARMTAKPVKCLLSREQTLLGTGNRPAGNLKLKAGVKKDGTLTAFEFTYLATGGAYDSNGISLADRVVRELYTCPNVRCESTDVFAHTGPARPFRAPGHPQGAWALEQMMDALAQAIGMDPVELRLKNIPTVNQAMPGNPPYTSTGLRECLMKGAETFGWKAAKKSKPAPRDGGHIRTGVGMAACLWAYGGGGPPSTILLKLFPDGTMNLNMGNSDLGTGTKTVMAMVVAEELGVRPEAIQIENADTGTTQYATLSGGSKTIPTESPAVRAAAVNLKQQLFAIAAGELKVDATDLTIRAGEIVSLKDPSKKVAITGLEPLKKRGVLVGIGYRGPNPPNKWVNPFGAQFCEVKVNTRTGEVRVERFVAAQESGRVMNRLTYDSQVIGGVTMGIGFALTEARVLDAGETGKLCNRNLYDYKIPTALEAPREIVTVPIDPQDTEANTVGAKGLGEPVTIPTAAAIANAVYDAVGIRVTATPIDPVQLCRLLAQRERKG